MKTGKYLLTSEATGGDTLMMMMKISGANFVNEDGEAWHRKMKLQEKCNQSFCVDLLRMMLLNL